MKNLMVVIVLVAAAAGIYIFVWPMLQGQVSGTAGALQRVEGPGGEIAGRVVCAANPPGLLPPG